MKKKERAAVISQESLAAGIFSMWIRTDAAEEARPGQFISMYTEDGTKLLPRPISICEIDREGQALRVVYRVTGPDTRTEQFSRLGAGDGIWLVGPLGNGFPVEKAEGKRAFLMGGGIGVPPILELAKQMKCEKKQIVVGYRASAFGNARGRRLAVRRGPQRRSLSLPSLRSRISGFSGRRLRPRRCGNRQRSRPCAELRRNAQTGHRASCHHA